MTDHEPGAPGTDWEQRLRKTFAEPGLAGLAAAALDLRDGPTVPGDAVPPPSPPPSPAGNAVR